MDIVVAELIIKEGALNGIFVEQRRIFPGQIIDTRQLLKDGPCCITDEPTNEDFCSYVIRIPDSAMVDFGETLAKTACESCVNYMVENDMKRVYLNVRMKKAQNETQVVVTYQMITV